MRLRFQQLLKFAGIAFPLFLVWFCWQLFGPAPDIVVSKQTTYITAPLRPDGLPDYEKYLLERSREGVTPENNAAVLLWQANGQGRNAEGHEFELIKQEIGITDLLPREERLQDVYGRKMENRIKEWLEAEGRLGRIEKPMQEDFWDDSQLESDETSGEYVAEELLCQLESRPWTLEQIPLMKEWLDVNERPLRLIVEASQRPRFHSPSPTFLNDTYESLLDSREYGSQVARQSAQNLGCRAMWHIGEGRHDEAWNDILAMHRLARLVSQGQSMLDQIVAHRMNEMTCQATLTLLESSDLATDSARKVRRDLNELTEFSTMAGVLENHERCFMLDTILKGYREFASSRIHFDWNVALTDANRCCDKLFAVHAIDNRAERQKAYDHLELGLTFDDGNKSIGEWIGWFASRSQRNSELSDMLVSAFLPSARSHLKMQDDANTNLTLTQLAAAIAVYRAEHGEYPENLEVLVPDILDSKPNDLYDNSFVYRLTPKGYLLYSLGTNGRDDEGSRPGVFRGYNTYEIPFESLEVLLGNEMPTIENDSEVADAKEPEMRPFSENDDFDDVIPSDADDIAIRVPLPKLELPKAKTE